MMASKRGLILRVFELIGQANEGRLKFPGFLEVHGKAAKKRRGQRGQAVSKRISLGGEGHEYPSLVGPVAPAGDIGERFEAFEQWGEGAAVQMKPLPDLAHRERVPRLLPED